MEESESNCLIPLKLGYQFRNDSLLVTALTHRSAGKHNNERLEYLGDAILGFIIAASLFEKFPSASEGELTRLRASLVRKETLAQLANKLELGNYLNLGSGEKKSGGWRRDSILANAFEAVIGAVYLDSDYQTCFELVTQLYQDKLDGISPGEIDKDPKTRLQEYLQAEKLPLPSYTVLSEEGEAHDRIFTISCEINLLTEPVIAEGKSKRSAEQSAAKMVLDLLNISDG